MSDLYKVDGLPAKIEVDVIRALEGLECGTFSARLRQFGPDFVAFRNGISISIELLDLLGDLPPRDDYDRTQRDLVCDTLDSLWCAERALLFGYENQTLVLLRRAYETTALMAYFLNYPDRINEWEGGKMIRQSHIRSALGNAPVAESKEGLDEMYRVYSLFSHVNRRTVYHRLLGEGNHLTLGCQGNVSEDTVASVACELLRQTMWFVDVANFVFVKLGIPPDQYVQRMLGYRDEVQALVRRLPRLFSEKPASGISA